MPKKNIRDMIGYGSKNLNVTWPNNARIAVQIVLNYEEGAENCVLNGDKNSEVFLSEIIDAQPIKGGISTWSLCMSTVHEVDFGGYTSYFKKRKYQ